MVTISVVGAAVAALGEEEAAETVGRLVGQAGATVVTGGLGGVMAAASRGAQAVGAVTVGLLPGSDRGAANPWVQVALPTGLGEARNTLVVRAADALVAIGGEYGTLSEIAFALKTGVPVVGLGTWELHRRGEVDPGVLVVATAQEAADTALRLAAGR